MKEIVNSSINKYSPFKVIDLDDRTWPTQQIIKSPIGCSVDLRDGNQSLIEPMGMEKKLRFFSLLIDLGFKEIEVGFPSASDTEFNFVRELIEKNLIPEDVKIQVLTQAREHLIERTFESVKGAKNVIMHLYNSTSTLQREVVFKQDKNGILKIATDGARLVKDLAIKNTNTINKSASNITDDNQKRADFIESSVVDDEDLNVNTSKSSKSSSFLKWLFIIIGIILLFLLLRNCSSRDAEYYYNRGVDRAESGKYDKAEKDFENAIDIDKTYIDPFVSRGEMYLQNGEYQNAKYDLDEAILLDPENWYTYYLRGVANMRLSSSKYSRTNEYAINDFSNSIALNSSNENGKSYYYRGKVYEFTNNDNSCLDFYQACEFNTLDSCEIIDEICRPKTGFRPYDKIFGPGITSGDRDFNVINNCEYDMVITIKDNRTRRSVRTEYVRSGEKLVIENIPNSRYNVEYLQGINWSFNKRLSDGISKGGFLIDQKTKSVNMIYNYSGYKMRGFENCVIGGEITSDDISEDQFFNK